MLSVFCELFNELGLNRRRKSDSCQSRRSGEQSDFVAPATGNYASTSQTPHGNNQEHNHISGSSFTSDSVGPSFFGPPSAKRPRQDFSTSGRPQLLLLITFRFSSIVRVAVVSNFERFPIFAPASSSSPLLHFRQQLHV